MSGNSLTKIGRPTKYSSKIPNFVLNYTEKSLKEGTFPTFEGLAISLGVSTRTLYAWEKEFLDFLHTTELLRDTQRALLIENGLSGKYSTSFSIFLLKALHGFSDGKLFEAVQNNYMDISPDLLAEALKIMKEKPKILADYSQ